MSKLTFKSNGESLQDFPIEKERIIIGRRPECEIRLDDSAVSGRHAMIITIMDDSFLEDLGSTNGTILNGQQVKKHPLHSGDIILIGRTEITFVSEAKQEDEEDFERTVMIKPSSAIAAAAAAKLAEQAGGGPDLSRSSGKSEEGARKGDSSYQIGRLSVLSGPSSGKSMPLTKALVTLGKPGQQVAAISRRSQGYFLTHIESDGDGKRYPVVNGEPIGSRAHPLKDQDSIEIAGINLKFTMEDARPENPIPRVDP